MSMAERRPGNGRNDFELEWLTTMWKIVLTQTGAHFVLESRVGENVRDMSGIAEECPISIQASQPLFMLVGFSESAQDIAKILGFLAPWAGYHTKWPIGSICRSS
jgi:SLOG cluster2